MFIHACENFMISRPGKNICYNQILLNICMRTSFLNKYMPYFKNNFELKLIENYFNLILENITRYVLLLYMLFKLDIYDFTRCKVMHEAEYLKLILQRKKLPVVIYYSSSTITFKLKKNCY